MIRREQSRKEGEQTGDGRHDNGGCRSNQQCDGQRSRHVHVVVLLERMTGSANGMLLPPYDLATYLKKRFHDIGITIFYLRDRETSVLAKIRFVGVRVG
jgi:hypothetical protein